MRKRQKPKCNVLNWKPLEFDQEHSISIEEFRNEVGDELATGLLDAYQPGDKLYAYCTSRDLWDKMMGSAGYFLKRNGEVIGSLTVKMN